jgi:predicted permease
METLLQDVTYGFRMLRKSPVFTAIAILTLALGIGASTAIFSVVNAVLLRPLPYQDSERLTVILHHGRDPVAPANFLDWQKLNGSFEDMGAADYWTPNASGTENTEKIWALRITTNLLPMLGVQPVLGRVFTPAAQESNSEHEVVLSYSFWQSHFGRSPQALGKQIRLDGEPYTVVGVMPREFKFAPFWATKAELWAPLVFGDRASSRTSNSLRIFARLKRGVSLERAQSEMDAITGHLEQMFPGTNSDVKVVSLKEKVVGNVRPALLVLLAAVLFVLLIACANVAHMLLARSSARQKEIAIRSALGAKPGRVVRQFLTESLLLSLAGGAAGWFLALGGIRGLVALSPAELPRVETIRPDANVLLFALASSLFAGLIFGLAPALRAAAPHLSDVLKEGERGSSEKIRRNRVRSLLVASEFALALVLLAGAGLMIRSFLALQKVDPGFNPHNLLSAVISVKGTREAAPGKRALFYQELVADVGRLPGVESVSAINHLPLGGDAWGFSFHVEGEPAPKPGQTPSATYRVVLPGYFRTMKMSLLRGRDVSESDTLDAPPVVVINDYFARRHWPGQDAVGKRITLDDLQSQPTWLTVVGVVNNAVRSDWTDTPYEEMFLPYLQNRRYLQDTASHFSYLTLVVRTSGDSAALAPTIRRAVSSLDQNVPLSEVQTMDQVVADANAGTRFYLLLLGIFAAVAVLLAAVGIYGVMSYSVSRRTHEIGIRMALGARRTDVVTPIVADGLVLAMLGVGAGLVGAFTVTRVMASMLYSVRATDPITFAGVTMVLMAVAAAASFLPAWRAAKVDPVVALRHE